MGTPNREPQEYSRKIIGIYLPGSLDSIIFRLKSLRLRQMGWEVHPLPWYSHGFLLSDAGEDPCSQGCLKLGAWARNTIMSYIGCIYIYIYVFWGYIGIIEKNMETSIVAYIGGI